ncbi:MAG: translation initiation factor IF-1 [Firmicutes bacterium]|nr:translation initiation factor IF-1 [Bacillota bacterium]
MSKDHITVDGEVVEVLPNSLFRVKIQNDHIITVYLSGRMRINSIKVLQGDKVKLEVSPYDLTKGRIIFRYK